MFSDPDLLKPDPDSNLPNPDLGWFLFVSGYNRGPDPDQGFNNEEKFLVKKSSYMSS